MSRNVVAVAGLALLLGVTARPAHALADGEVVKAHIPFAFQVGATPMPAGDYVLKTIDINARGLIEIRSAGGAGPAAAFLTIPEGAGSIASAQLKFDDVGSQRFLRAILVPGQGGDELPVASAEVQAAREIAAQPVHAKAANHS